MGLPIISTFSGGPEDIITEEVGKIVPPDDAYALKDAMEFVEQNHHHYPSDRLREYAIAHFGRRAVVSKWMAIYSSNFNSKPR